MSNQKLYYTDSYVTEFEANLIEVMPYEKQYALILDKTYFYPESGGQPSDIGWIGHLQVTYVTEKDGRILHITSKELLLGPVQCKIAWDPRFDNMQQHSGQHILSAAFYKLYGGETSSFHIGKESSTIEIDLSSFDAVMAEKLEKTVNEAIYKNAPVAASIVSREELAALPLRKTPQVDSNIRIIHIEGVDCTPCGGTHVKTTGEIGMIKIKKWEKLKNSYKFDFVCGSRTLKDYTYKNHLVNKLGTCLSAKESDVEGAFIRFTEDYKVLQKQLSQLRSEMVEVEVQRLANTAIEQNGRKVICHSFDNREFNDLKLIAQALTALPSHIVLLATKGASCQVIFSRSEDVDVPMNHLLKSILPLLNGKGGGSPKSAQGGGSGDIEAALNTAFEKLKTAD
jgi:alanyl-tRNA synthetase